MKVLGSVHVKSGFEAFGCKVGKQQLIVDYLI